MSAAHPTVAMLYPGHSAEDEYPLLERLIGDVRLPVVHTWEGPTDHDVAALLALGAREPLAAAASAALAHSPDALMWACTSGSFVYGPRVHEQASWIAQAAGAPASSTSIAFVEALRHLGLGRVAVAATYPVEVTRHFTGLLGDAGVDVLAVASHDIPSGEDAGRLPPDAVRELVGGHARYPAGTQALLVPDTALHTVGLLSRLEDDLGLAVLTANQVTPWHGLRLAGWRGRAGGLGRLFA